MAYEHGISVQEKAPARVPSQTTSGLQVVIGTAPIHLINNPQSAVNTPIVAYSMDDVKNKLGYLDAFDKYTLSQSAYASFEVMGVAPVVFINILDPAIHSKPANGSAKVEKGIALIEDDGVLLDSITVRNEGGETTFVKGTDYLLSFNPAGKAQISIIPGGEIGAGITLAVSYSKLDPDLVNEADIIGGYDVVTKKYKGIELIREVHPKFGLLPGQILAPGWSHKPEIAAVLAAKAVKINGNFNIQAILDVDSGAARSYEDVEKWKQDNGYNMPKSIVLWPMVKKNNKKLWYSAVYAALTAKIDSENDNIPSQPPSNKELFIDATILPDGTEVFLDQPQANTLNGVGVVTALNWGYWRSWGNNMAVYPDVKDTHERFISVRRLLDWWGNTFIINYFDRVDNPLNFRLVESVVDAENIRANGYQSSGHISGASIEFREDMNPADQILGGKMVFHQKIGAFGPAENIVNIIEFDPTSVTESLFGGE